MKSLRNVVNGEVRFAIPANSPCPCGSGQIASLCCLTAISPRKIPASTRPPPPRTGRSLDWCYASPLADCGTRCSREHDFSESLLHYLNREKKLTVGGLPWAQGEGRIVPPKALAASVLCCYELVLSMSGFPSRSFDGRDFAYRPLEFYATGRDFEKSVLFSWDGAADLGTVTIEIGGT